jgi:CHASE2 domain-containing sensor protein
MLQLLDRLPARPPREPSHPARESFARVLAELDGPKPQPASPYIDWLLPPSNAEDTFATVLVPEHKPLTINPETETALPLGLRSVLKDKIVLVGAAFVDRNRHLTPLSVADKLPVPGVTIHAQILAQLLDGRSVSELSTRAESVAVFILALVGYVLGWRARLHRYGTATHIFGVVVLALIGATVFDRAHLIIPTTTLLFGWLAGVIGGHYSGSVLRRLAVRERTLADVKS